MKEEHRQFIEWAEEVGLNSQMTYQEAADLGRLDEWWRDCALSLFEEINRPPVNARPKIVEQI